MFTKVLVAAAALTAAVVATAPAEAKTHVNIGFGFGGGYGGGYYGDDYYGGYDGGGYYPVYSGDYAGISCWKAKHIVESHGFYKVQPTDCEGKYMRFKAKRSGDWYRVRVDRWGHIVDVDGI
jgi:hypothetical protein